MLWTKRREIEDRWPTPDQGDSFLFAVAELGEVVDAHMRTKGQYVRNNEHLRAVQDEMADVAMMLLTALGDDPEWPGMDDMPDTFESFGIGEIVSTMSEVMAWYTYADDVDVDSIMSYQIVWVLSGLYVYFEARGETLASAVSQRLARIEAKVTQEEMAIA